MLPTAMGLKPKPLWEMVARELNPIVVFVCVSISIIGCVYVSLCFVLVCSGLSVLRAYLMVAVPTCLKIPFVFGFAIVVVSVWLCFCFVFVLVILL